MGIVHYVLSSTARLVVVAVALTGWFASQAWLGARAPLPVDAGDGSGPAYYIGDKLHDLLTPGTDYLHAHPSAADTLLIVSSGAIDVFGLFFVAYSVLGPSVRPMFGILMCFALRQTMQALCVLSSPPRMIWRDPGVPSIFVTYDTGSDFFYSGHTAISVLCMVELLRLRKSFSSSLVRVALALMAVGFVLLEVSTVLVLRAHWTMDVFTGAVAGRYSALIALRHAHVVDDALASIVGAITGQASHPKSD